MEGTDKAHKNGEAMGLVGVRLTDQLGDMACSTLSFGQLNAANALLLDFLQFVVSDARKRLDCGNLVLFCNAWIGFDER